jgi:hypothetical protein
MKNTSKEFFVENMWLVHQAFMIFWIFLGVGIFFWFSREQVYYYGDPAIEEPLLRSIPVWISLPYVIVFLVALFPLMVYQIRLWVSHIRKQIALKRHVFGDAEA